MSSTREPGGGTQSVERALSLLQAFTGEKPVWRIGELAQLTGLGQSTVSRLVGTLESLGFLTQDSHSGLYGIGPTVVGLAGVALNQSPLHQHARQIAQDLAFDLALGANVAERHDNKYFYLCHFEGHLLPRSFTMVGRTGPLHATAIGKALLLDMADKDVESLLGSSYDMYTPRTITSLEELLEVLRTSRERGYTTETEELALGRACIAAPIRDRTGAIVGALSVGGPLSAMIPPNPGSDRPMSTTRQEEIAGRVLESTDRISTSLGYHGLPAQPTRRHTPTPMTTVGAD